jgi:23S rRNA (cytosine1962-C5)-methyltransferase
VNELERAWRWRSERGLMRAGSLRVFYGPGESSGEWKSLALDRFEDHYWATWWGAAGQLSPTAAAIERLADFLGGKGALSAVVLFRPQKGTPELPVALLGSPSDAPLIAGENGLRFQIRLLGVRHPGLFLDHAPLRGWLRQRAAGWRVLNTFAYTGSLSVAAAAGGATEVTTLDLSTSTVRWAEDNWKVNDLPAERGRFISGDVFEWLPRLARKGERFDCVILDPPSFSRGKKGSFSVAKDLRKLHELAIAVLGEQGILVTSTNSEELPQARFESEVLAAARAARSDFEVLARIDLPETFPTRLAGPADRYLKGLILRRV